MAITSPQWFIAELGLASSSPYINVQRFRCAKLETLQILGFSPAALRCVFAFCPRDTGETLHSIAAGIKAKQFILLVDSKLYILRQWAILTSQDAEGRTDIFRGSNGDFCAEADSALMRIKRTSAPFRCHSAREQGTMFPLRRLVYCLWRCMHLRADFAGFRLPPASASANQQRNSFHRVT